MDQIFIKQNYDNTPRDSLLLFSALSDHLACVASVCKRTFEPKNDELKKTRTFDIKSITAFSDEIKSIDFLNIYNNDLPVDPNINYNIVHKKLHDALDKHIPLKVIKLNKYKHKKSEWITEGILISIKYRDKLYKIKKCSTTDDEYERNSTNLRTYNNILNKAIREAKFNYYQKQFQRHRNNMKKSWSTLGTLLKRHKKDNFPNAFLVNNAEITDYSQIAKGFNDYYKNICSDIQEPVNSRNERDSI